MAPFPVPRNRLGVGNTLSLPSAKNQNRRIPILSAKAKRVLLLLLLRLERQKRPRPLACINLLFPSHGIIALLLRQSFHPNSSIHLTYRQLERRVNKSRWVINGIAKYQCLEKRRQRIAYRVQMYQPKRSIYLVESNLC